MGKRSKINVGISGGAGYTGGELIRVLLNHPEVHLTYIHSKSNANKPVCNIHSDLIGETDIIFTDDPQDEIDVLFLCLKHGESARFLEEGQISEKTKVIDLSQDFRMEDSETATFADRKFVYGLPELNKPKIRKASNIANPGCFATAIELALLPFAQQDLLPADIHINGITGSTGAGQGLSKTSHFSWRNGNVSTYKMMEHQHLKEINQSIKALQKSFSGRFYFIPYRGNFSRGIMITAYFYSELSYEEACELVRGFYLHHPFVHVSDTNPALKQVVNSNKCILYMEKHEETLVIISIIDNLLKGASGQAVQNMNLMFGLEETSGLKLKTINY